MVENRPGASTRIAVQALKASEPNGQTLLAARDAIVTLFAHVFREVGCDPFNGTYARLSDDQTAVRLSDEVNEELKETVPDGMSIGMVLSPSIVNFRKMSQLEQNNANLACPAQ